MNLLLTDYFPTPSEINAAAIINARTRLASYLAVWWPELDSRPGAVFGDTYLTPESVLMAALEIAAAQYKSDSILSNVANGIVYDSDFVTQFLANFGVSAQSAIQATGTILIIFSANQGYVLDQNATFVFNGSTFQINPDAGNPVVVSPVGSTTGNWVLTQIAPGQFAIYLPVVGPSGSVVSDGDVPTFSLTQTQIISVAAAGNFDSGTPSESLSQMAVRAQKTFPSSSLTSRSGAISFLTNHWPTLVGASAVINGDTEMIRASQNPLGIAQGALDVYVKAGTNFTAGQLVVTLTYDYVQQGWLGLLGLPVVPAFFDLSNGIFQVNNFTAGHAVNTMFARSVNTPVDNLGVAFSKYQQLGVLVTDTNPANILQPNVGAIEETTGSSVTLSVTGQYRGYAFFGGVNRSINLRLQASTTLNGVPAVLATAVDEANGDTAQVYFVADSTVNPTMGIIAMGTQDYEEMFNGMNLQIVSPGGGFNPANFLGANFEFSFSGMTATFNVNYLFDPVLVQVDASVQDPDNTPVNVSIFTKSFVPCYIDTFVVNYQIPFGGTFNATTAQQQIFNYVNGLAYPASYVESEIGSIVTANGASGLLSVTKRGTFYPSLGNTYIDKSGNKTVIPRYLTTTLVPPTNSSGFGPRNTAFILNLSTILFNASVSV